MQLVYTNWVGKTLPIILLITLVTLISYFSKFRMIIIFEGYSVDVLIS